MIIRVIWLATRRIFFLLKKGFHKLKNTHELSKTGIETLYTIFQIKQKCKIRDFKEKS